MNYTEEMTEELVEAYVTAEDKDAVVKFYSEKFEKPTKSIIGKLSKEGVYQKKQYVNKLGKPPITKKEMIVGLSELLEIDPDKILGLEKMPKIELEFLVAKINEIAAK